MTFDQFVELVSATTDLYPELRQGQRTSNLLTEVRPDLAAAIHGTDADPYYTDTNLQAFWAHIAPEWATTP